MNNAESPEFYIYVGEELTIEMPAVRCNERLTKELLDGTVAKIVRERLGNGESVESIHYDLSYAYNAWFLRYLGDENNDLDN